MSRVDTVKRGVLGAARRVSPRWESLLLMRGPLGDVLPPDLDTLDRARGLPGRVLELPGVDLRQRAQLERLAGWEGAHDALFTELRADPALNRGAAGAEYVDNEFYGTPDAEVYAAMIADVRPEAIVEIGAGYSTLIARRTIDRLGLGARLLVVDPEPRTEVAPYADEVTTAPVEGVDPGHLPLGARSLLFIDSSHVVRAGGDVPHLLNYVVPGLPAGAVVHVHDVFVPYDYPDSYRARLYSEQYVLQALLSDSPRYRLLFATHMMCRREPEAMRRVFGAEVARDPRQFGVSLWFEVVDGARRS